MCVCVLEGECVCKCVCDPTHMLVQLHKPLSLSLGGSSLVHVCVSPHTLMHTHPCEHECRYELHHDVCVLACGLH